MMLFCLLVLCLDNGDVATRIEFQSPLDGDGFALEQPFAMSFAPNGQLFVLDRAPGRIHHWGAGGEYLGSFASQGRDGGQIHWPVRIYASDDSVWIWENRFRISLWTYAGKMKRVISLPGIIPHNFGVTPEGQLLLSYHRNPFAPGFSHVFELYSSEGQLIRELKTNPQDWLIPSEKGPQHAKVRAFGPEGDLQQDSRGQYWFGFSRDAVLHRLGDDGKIAESRTFQLETGLPTPEDLTLMAELPIPLGVDGSGPKSYYTHFLIKGDKIVFVRTPMGGMPPVNENHPANGFYRAEYRVCRLADGAPVTDGSYQFPTGSAVLYRNGHILALIRREDGNFSMEEINLRGLE